MSLSKNLIEMQERIKELFEGINNKIEDLNKICKSIRDENDQSRYVMGLDTLYFQITLYSNDYKNLNGSKDLIFNRIYGDYYKIYKRIQKYVNSNINDNEILKLMENYKKLPVYNRIDIHQNYGNDNINSIHNHNLKLIEKLEALYNKKVEKKEEYKKFNKNGLDLDGFIFAYDTNLSLIKMNTDLFKKYIMYYNQMHSVYLNKFIKKLKGIHDEIKKLNSESFSSKSKTDEDKTTKDEETASSDETGGTESTESTGSGDGTGNDDETDGSDGTDESVDKSDKAKSIDDEVAQEMAANIIEDTIKKIT